MPEGHTVHRIARQFSEEFVSKRVLVSSPQGRFSQAEVVSGKKLISAEAYGKQLFLDFGSELVRIHLGIYGKWNFQKFSSIAPEPIGQVRARFQVRGLVADLRGPTACEVLGVDSLDAYLKKLGPDPIRNEKNGKQSFFSNVQSSQRPIAELLMNQSVVAGIGNVYRAELLFRAGLNPFTPGRKVSEERLSQIWSDAVKLMPLGVKTGFMLTREGFLKAAVEPEDRYYVYKRSGENCRECGGKVVMEILAGRKLYYCRRCQK